MINKIREHKTLFKFLSSSILSLPVSILASFFTLKYIDPYFIGVWSAFTIFDTYLNIIKLGIYNGLNRELPFALGAGDTEKATTYVRTTYYFTIINIVFVLLISPFLIIRYWDKTIILVTLLVYIVRILISFYSNYLSGTFRTSDNFNKLSNIQVANVVVKLVLCPLLLLGFNGYLIFEIGQVFLEMIFLHYYKPFKVSPYFSKSAFIHLLKIGFPIFLMSYLIGFIDSIPRLYIINYGDTRLVGIYHPIFLLLGVMSIFPNVMTMYIYPKFSFSLGQNNDIMSLWNKMKKIYLFSFFGILVFSVIVFLCMDLFAMFFPKYIESIPYIKIGLLITPFIIFKYGYMLSLVAKNYKSMVFYVCFYGLVQIVSILILQRFYKDVVSISIYSQVITSFLTLIFSIWLNDKLVKEYTYKAIKA